MNQYNRRNNKHSKLLVPERGIYMHKMYKSLGTLWEDNTTNSTNNASSPKALTAANKQNDAKLSRAATPLSATLKKRS